MPLYNPGERDAASATPQPIGTAAVGTGTTDARDDHVHATGAGTPSTQAFGDAAATGSGPAASMTDHKHAMPALGTTTAAIGTSAGGSAVTPSKSDHVHATGAGTPSTQAFGDAAATGSGPAASMTDHKHAMPADPVTAHAAAADPHTGYVLESLLDAKGDLITASADNTPAKLTAGADDTILMADAAAGGGLKWVASATPSTQAFADAAAVGTGDTFTRGDHKHAMPTLGFGLTGNSAPAVSLTTAETFVTATTSISASTYADITGATVSLVAGTWLILATVVASMVTTTAGILVAAITDNANTVIAEASQGNPVGTATVAQNATISLSAIVTPGSTTTYKLRAARGTTTYTSTYVVMDGASLNTANNTTDNSDKGTSIRAIRVA